MSELRYIEFECDYTDEHGDSCDNSSIQPGWNVGEAKRVARDEGWSLGREQVLCPEHRRDRGRRRE